MMDRAELIGQLDATQKFFNTTLRCFDDGDGDFAPVPGLLPVKAHVAHVALTLDWFVEGAFGSGWDMDFEEGDRQCRAVASLAEAKQMLDRAFANVKRTIEQASPEQLAERIRDERILGPAPRAAIIPAIVDHTAHHRGSLAVYARLVGRTPAMPYM